MFFLKNMSTTWFSIALIFTFHPSSINLSTQFNINVHINVSIWKFTVHSLIEMSTCCPRPHGKRTPNFSLY